MPSSFPPYLPYAGAGTLGIKRLLHDSIGGFDESFLAVEDMDYCFRAQLAGATLHFMPDTIVSYRLRTSLGGIYAQARRRGQNEVWLCKKFRSTRARELWRWRAYLAEWIEMVKRLPVLLPKPQGRARLMWKMGKMISGLKGSFIYGLPPTI